MTSISREYCGEEFVLDTDDLISHIENYNKEISVLPIHKRPKALLATLDVKALYPSIRPTEALDALEEAFSEDATHTSELKMAIL